MRCSASSNMEMGGPWAILNSGQRKRAILNPDSSPSASRLPLADGAARESLLFRLAPAVLLQDLVGNFAGPTAVASVIH